jgi:hypothetical protein
LERSVRAAGEAAGARAEELGAFASGAAEGYLGDSNADNAFWAGQRWANKKTEESRQRLDQRLSELDAQDRELDNATGLKKLTGKASVKSKKLGASIGNIIEEGIYDIPKAGQDLPDAWKNTKDAGREMMAGNWKGAAKAGGKAAGILANEAGRVSFVGGRVKQLAKGAKAGLSAAARGAKRAAKEGAEQADRAIGRQITKETGTLTKKQESAISKIDNIIKDHLKPHDFSGTSRDMLGNPVPKSGGGYYNHLEEMNNSLQGLRNNAKTLEGTNNPEAQKAYKKAIEKIKEIEGVLKGHGI